MHYINAAANIIVATIAVRCSHCYVRWLHRRRRNHRSHAEALVWPMRSVCFGVCPFFVSKKNWKLRTNS